MNYGLLEIKDNKIFLDISGEKIESTNPTEIGYALIQSVEDAKEISNEHLFFNKDRFRDFLKLNNLRTTPERLIIHNQVFLTEKEFNPEDIYQQFYYDKYIISRATIYSVLKLLVDFGLIIQIPKTDRKTYYKRV